MAIKVALEVVGDVSLAELEPLRGGLRCVVVREGHNSYDDNRVGCCVELDISRMVSYTQGRL